MLYAEVHRNLGARHCLVLAGKHNNPFIAIFPKGQTACRRAVHLHRQHSLVDADQFVRDVHVAVAEVDADAHVFTRHFQEVEFGIRIRIRIRISNVSWRDQRAYVNFLGMGNNERRVL